MFFEQLLLQIHQKYDGQRTVFSAFHLLKGKKSGQTIQDVGLFHVKPYFHLMPKLSKDQYAQAIEALEQKKWLAIDEQQKISVTALGMEFIDTNKTYFNGWFLRGREHLFFSRLQLVTQSISNSIASKKRFSPIVKEEQTQIFVRHYLLTIHYNEETVKREFRKQLYFALQEMPTTELVKNLIVYRLTGFQLSGWTWSQLVQKSGYTELDLHIQFVHGLHSLLAIIFDNKQLTLLQPLLQSVKVSTVLTESTQKTVALLKKGYTLEQIATMRRLKINTIEDHIVEMAMSDPTFMIDKFISKVKLDEISTVLMTVSDKKLKPIKDVVPHISYFQIRLVLAWRGGQQDGQT